MGADGPTIEDLYSIRGNRDSIQRLIRRPPGSLVPFVGAGLSMPLGYPGWSQFLIDLAEEYTRREDETPLVEGVRRLLEASAFERAADLIIDRVGGRRPFDNGIRIAFSDQELPETIGGALSFLPQLSSGPVITTNFDHAIERVFEDGGRKFQHMLNGSDAERCIERFLGREPLLVKLHGDIDFLEGRILAGADYDDYYGAGRINYELALPTLLRQIATSNSILFLGCSLSVDRALEVIKSTAAEIRFVPHFAIVPLPPDDEAVDRRLHLEEELRLSPIWYPPDPQHKYVEVILEHVAREREEHVERVNGNGGGRPVPGGDDDEGPGPSRLLLGAIYGGLVALLVLVVAMYPWITGTTVVSGVKITIGLFDADMAEMEAFGQLVDKLNERLANQPGDVTRRIELRSPTYDKLTDALDALEAGEIDILGELSPAEIHEAHRRGAVPFISPMYGGSAAYDAVIIVSNKWIEGLPPGDIEGSAVQLPSKVVEDSIKPKLWRKVIEQACTSTGHSIALMDEESLSTSGFYYPRKIILDELRGETAFDKVVVAEFKDGTEEALVKAVAKNERFAGAVARFKLKGYSDQIDKVTVVQRIPLIPNGAFVASKTLATDEELMKFLRESWENATMNVLHPEVPAGAARAETLEDDLAPQLEPRWAAVDLSHYRTAFDVIEAVDPAVIRKQDLMARFLLAGVFILLVLCLTAVGLKRGRPARSQPHAAVR